MRARVEELEARLLKFSEGVAVTWEGASAAGEGRHSLGCAEQGNESDMDTQHQGNGERGRSDDRNDGEGHTESGHCFYRSH